MRSTIAKEDLEADFQGDLDELDTLAVEEDFNDSDFDGYDPTKDEDEDLVDWQDVY